MVLILKDYGDYLNFKTNLFCSLARAINRGDEERQRRIMRLYELLEDQWLRKCSMYNEE